jgi:PQQ-dependent catabolism-associated CXXCW motif protein
MIGVATLLFWLVFTGPGWADGAVLPPVGYRMDNYNAAVPEIVPGGRTIHTGELLALVGASPVVLVDVLPVQRRPDSMRPETPWMPLPHRNLPGSIWLPETGRGAVTSEVDAWFERELLAATAGDRGRPIVFYCRAQCWMSWNAARRAIEHGWTNVLWYPDGPEAWAAAGLRLVDAQPVPMR